MRQHRRRPAGWRGCRRCCWGCTRRPRQTQQGCGRYRPSWASSADVHGPAQPPDSGAAHIKRRHGSRRRGARVCDNPGAVAIVYVFYDLYFLHGHGPGHGGPKRLELSDGQPYRRCVPRASKGCTSGSPGARMTTFLMFVSNACFLSSCVSKNRAFNHHDKRFQERSREVGVVVGAANFARCRWPSPRPDAPRSAGKCVIACLRSRPVHCRSYRIHLPALLIPLPGHWLMNVLPCRPLLLGHVPPLSIDCRCVDPVESRHARQPMTRLFQLRPGNGQSCLLDGVKPTRPRECASRFNAVSNFTARPGHETSLSACI